MNEDRNLPAEMKNDKLYLWTTVLLMGVLPVASICADAWVFRADAGPVALLGKWFVFWAVGIRLFTAGIRQVVNPAFTIKSILNLESLDSQIVVRELGFANIGLGALGIGSLFYVPFRLAAAVAGGLFLGTAGLQHLILRPSGLNEKAAMISDLIVFIVLAIFTATRP
jgi:hypothetical protein